MFSHTSLPRSRKTFSDVQRWEPWKSSWALDPRCPRSTQYILACPTQCSFKRVITQGSFSRSGIWKDHWGRKVWWLWRETRWVESVPSTSLLLTLWGHVSEDTDLVKTDHKELGERLHSFPAWRRFMYLVCIPSVSAASSRPGWKHQEGSGEEQVLLWASLL